MFRPQLQLQNTVFHQETLGKRLILGLEKGIHKMSLAHHGVEGGEVFKEGGDVGKRPQGPQAEF